MEFWETLLFSFIGGALGAVSYNFVHRKFFKRKDALEFVSFKNATRAGQHVMGNVPGSDATLAPHINKGGKFFGTLKKYPAKTNEDIEFMDKLF